MPRKPKPPDLLARCCPSTQLRAGEYIRIGGALGTLGMGGAVIRNVGRLRASGHDRIELGVVPGERQWYIARNGKVFRYESEGKKAGPAYPPLDPTELESNEERGRWADALAREFIDTHTAPSVRKVVPAMVHRYHAMVAAYLQGAMVDQALKLVERNTEDFARACSADWGVRELTRGTPTIRHAITVSLALQLPVDDASMLVEYAAFFEMRLPIVQRETAARMYQEAARMLSLLLPVWNIRGAGTDWKTLGTSVEDIFHRQFVRMANDADARALAADVVMGMRQAVTEVGESPLAWQYQDRAGSPTSLEEAASNLAEYDSARPELDIEDRKL